MKSFISSLQGLPARSSRSPGCSPTGRIALFDWDLRRKLFVSPVPKVGTRGNHGRLNEGRFSELDGISPRGRVWIVML
jgi:hypothetical protein